MDSIAFMDSFRAIESALIAKAPGFDKKEGFLRLINYELAKGIINIDLAKQLYEIFTVRNHILNPQPLGYCPPPAIKETIDTINRILNIT